MTEALVEDINEKKEESFENPNIRINTTIEEIDRIKLRERISDLVNRYHNILDESIIEVFIIEQQIGYQDLKIYCTKIIVLAEKEKFEVTADNQNVYISFYRALFRLEKKIMNKAPSLALGPKRYPYNFSDNYAFKRRKENYTPIRGKAAGPVA